MHVCLQVRTKDNKFTESKFSKIRFIQFLPCRDVKNLERFSLVVQCITRIALIKLKQLPDYLKNLTEKKEEGATESKNEAEEATALREQLRMVKEESRREAEEARREAEEKLAAMREQHEQDRLQDVRAAQAQAEEEMKRRQQEQQEQKKIQQMQLGVWGFRCPQ